MAIHDTDGHNPHAHILLTVRPLNPDGTWQAKTEKEHLCVKDGIEKGFTAAEFKPAQADGWEKQYQYKLDKSGKKKAYFSPSVAEAQGLGCASKYPKSAKYDRQNPISERWNSEEQLVVWREAWANFVNRYLEQAGPEERIDHRSSADQGKDEQPTIHEGVAARAMEEKGFVSDRCELNRQIRRDNALLKSLKAAIAKLTDSLKRSIPAVASCWNPSAHDFWFCGSARIMLSPKRKKPEHIFPKQRPGLRATPICFPKCRRNAKNARPWPMNVTHCRCRRFPESGS